MLRKLIKFEFKVTARYFLPIYLAIFIMTLITKLFTSLEIFKGYLQIIPSLFTGLYVLTIFAVLILPTVIIVMRFYTNLVTREGYLMHTLPVKPSQHIISKALIAFIWNLISFLVVILSVAFFFIFPDNFEVAKDFWNTATQQLIAGFGGVNKTFIIFTIIMLVLSLISNIFYFYASIAIGQVISQNKIIGAIAAAIIINVITQAVSLIFILPFIFFSNVDVNSISFITTWMYPTLLIVNLLVTVGYYLVTNYILKKKLNLE